MPDDNAALGSRNSPVRPRRNGAEECGFQFRLPGALSWFGDFEHSVASTS
jgi:hypothetical protein